MKGELKHARICIHAAKRAAKCSTMQRRTSCQVNSSLVLPFIGMLVWKSGAFGKSLPPPWADTLPNLYIRKVYKKRLKGGRAKYRIYHIWFLLPRKTKALKALCDR